MTNEEAIIDIRENIQPIIGGKSLDIAISALEKQIPKKPLDVCTPVVTWGLCPTCKGELNKLGGRPNRVFQSNAFCPDCGQKLLWE